MTTTHSLIRSPQDAAVGGRAGALSLVGDPIDVAKAFEGRRILFVGGTGFVGKVAMSMLLSRYPSLGKLFALVRPGSGYTAETRFFQKIAKSRPFEPVRKAFGDATESYLRDKVVPLGGDVSRPSVGLSDADKARLTADGPLDLIINCAGLVSFNPSLESALRINVYGVNNVMELARATGAKVVHVSTCYVAGQREGEVWEDEPLIGYFPRRPGHQRSTDAGSALRVGDFDPEAEIAKLRAIVEDTIVLVRSRDHNGAVSRIKDLESEWDAQQSVLQPLDANGWTILDSQIDQALHAVRAAKPDDAAETRNLTSLTAALGQGNEHR